MSLFLSKPKILVFISGQSWENQILTYLQENRALAVGQNKLNVMDWGLMEKFILNPVLTSILTLHT